MAKKDMKKTKGGTLNFARGTTVQQDIHFNNTVNGGGTLNPGQISIADGSV